MYGNRIIQGLIMKEGFTLIELIVVMVIVGILAVVFVPNLSRALMTSNDNAAQANVSYVRELTLD